MHVDRGGAGPTRLASDRQTCLRSLRRPDGEARLLFLATMRMQPNYVASTGVVRWSYGRLSDRCMFVVMDKRHALGSPEAFGRRKDRL